MGEDEFNKSIHTSFLQEFSDALIALEPTERGTDCVLFLKMYLLLGNVVAQLLHSSAYSTKGTPGKAGVENLYF